VRRLGYPFRFVELAQEINQRMPAYVAQRVQEMLNDHEKAVRGSSVLILGVTYKPDIADQREPPARPVVRRLRRLGANVRFHDPHVDAWDVDGEDVPSADELAKELAAADITVLLQDHRDYDAETLAKARLLLDTRGRIPRDTAGEHIEVL